MSLSPGVSASEIRKIIREELKPIEGRLERIENRLDGVGRRLDKVKRRLDGVEMGLLILADNLPGNVPGRTSHVRRQIEAAFAKSAGDD